MAILQPWASNPGFTAYASPSRFKILTFYGKTLSQRPPSAAVRAGGGIESALGDTPSIPS